MEDQKEKAAGTVLGGIEMRFRTELLAPAARKVG
jgi:hypothetical protein